MKPSLLIGLFFSFLSFNIKNFAQTPDLGSAGQFTLFTTTGAVGNTGISGISGMVGTNAGAITGYVLIPGQEQNGNSVTVLAAADLQIAYNEIYSRAHTFPPHIPVLGNDEVLTPGVYLIQGAGSIEGNLILDAQGSQNALFIFKVQGAFSPGPSSKILLANGAQSCKIFWLVEGGAVAIAALSEMKGTFIANPGAVSMAAGSSLEGRLLSTTGAVATDGVIASEPLCWALPVTLIDFKAVKSQHSIGLWWTVSDESSLSGYELERSADGRNFYRLALIAPLQSPFLQTYNWFDRAPLPAINFYRLKMMDIDGAFKYSIVLKIHMDATNLIMHYTNPVRDHVLSMQMDGQYSGKILLAIFNMRGEKMMQSKLDIKEGDVVKNIALNESLIPGMYLLQFVKASGMTQTIKFIVE